MIEAKRGSSGPRRLQDRTRVLLQGEDFLRPIAMVLGALSVKAGKLYRPGTDGGAREVAVEA